MKNKIILKELQQGKIKPQQKKEKKKGRGATWLIIFNLSLKTVFSYLIKCNTASFGE